MFVFQLIECAAAVSVKGDSDDDGGCGVTRELKEAMARIASISADVESSISEMREDLKVRKMFNRTEAKIQQMSMTKYKPHFAERGRGGAPVPGHGKPYLVQ